MQPSNAPTRRIFRAALSRRNSRMILPGLKSRYDYFRHGTTTRTHVEPNVAECKTPLCMRLSMDCRKIEPQHAAVLFDMIVRNVSTYQPLKPFADQ